MKVHVDSCARRTYREDNEGCISARVCKWREFPTSTDRWKKFCGTKSSGNWISVRLKKYTTISSISIARASEEIFVRSFETALLVAKYRNRNIARVQREKKKNEAKRYFPLLKLALTFIFISSASLLSEHFSNTLIRKRRDTILSGGMNNPDYSLLRSNIFSPRRNANNLTKFYFRKWKSFFLPWKLL